MSLTLSKGQKLDLVKDNPGLDNIVLGLGWNPNQGNGADFDLDAFAILEDENKKGLWFADGNQALIYFNQKSSPEGAIEHQGDNLTGAGAAGGDKEQIVVHLSKIAADVKRISFGANIYDAVARGQNFGMVQDAYIRLFNATTNEEILRYDLSEDASSANGVVFGSLYLNKGEWKFEANEQIRNGDLLEIFDSFTGN